MARSAAAPRCLVFVCGLAALYWGGAFTGAPLTARRSVHVARGGVAKDGPFTPTVEGFKIIMGEEQLKSLRQYFIKLHGDAQNAAIDTYDTEMGKAFMGWLFNQADTDGNGTIDKEELQVACKKLGFDWIDEKKADKLFNKVDKDESEGIDLDEFTTSMPKFFKQSTLKLAKKNGADLGLMS